MNSKKYAVLFLVAIIGLSLAACGSGKKTAATAAIKAAEDAYNAVKNDLVQYVPDEAKGIEDAISSAKENLEKREFDAALNAVKAIPDKVKELTAAAEAKKAELGAGWEELSGELPKMLETIKSRLDVLSASKKLPANLNKAALDGAKSGYEMAAGMWGEATAAFSAGNLADAMAKAKTVQEKAVEVMTTLGMKVPEAATK